MRLFLHPGWWKTGTSALQDHLAERYDELRRHGILYPKAGREIDNAHHGLALSLAPRSGLSTEYRSSEIIDAILNEAAGVETVIISSELLPNVFKLQSAKTLVECFSEINLIFCVRPQEQLIASLFKQVVKDPDVLFDNSAFGVFDVFGQNLSQLNFFETIEAWVNAAGPLINKVSVVEYSKTVVSDILEVLSIDASPPVATGSNVSPSDLVTLVLHALMDVRSGMGLEKRHSLIRFVTAFLADVPSHRSVLSSSDMSKIATIFKHSNNALASKYLQRPTLFELCPDNFSRIGNVSGDQHDGQIGELAVAVYKAYQLNEAQS